MKINFLFHLYRKKMKKKIEGVRSSAIEQSPKSDQKRSMEKKNVYNISAENKFSIFNELCQSHHDSNKVRDPLTKYSKIEEIPLSQRESSLIYSQVFSKPISKSNPQGGVYFKFGIVKSYPELLERIITTGSPNRTYNEIIMEHQPCKLAFDLEWCDYEQTTLDSSTCPEALRNTAPQYTLQETLNQFKYQLFLVAGEVFGKTLDESNLVLLNSSRPIALF